MDFNPSGKSLSLSAADFHVSFASVYRWRSSKLLFSDVFTFLGGGVGGEEVASGVKLNSCHVRSSLTLCVSSSHDPIVRPHSPH